jgi:hypothetical protein
LGITVLAADGWLISECGVHAHCYITEKNRLISGATFHCHTINFHVALFLIIKFAVDPTFTNHAPQKAAEKRFFKFKGPRPFIIK